MNRRGPLLPRDRAHRVIPPDDLRLLLSASGRLGRAARIAAGSGARVSEVSSLHSDDVDPGEPFLSLERAAFDRPGTKGKRDQSGRSAARRLVRIPRTLHKTIVRYNGWFFPSPYPGRPHVTTRTLQYDLSTWCRRHQLRITWHDIRHTYATRLGSATGWNMEILALQLGHADERTSLVYTHIPEEVWESWFSTLSPTTTS